MSQQIYARIKKTSMYYFQTAPRQLFPVHVEHRNGDDYTVSGNSNFYRLADVNLFVVDDKGRELRIS